jgi:signal transduction histidine kinase
MIDNACEWGTATLMIFSENVGALVYYTHILPLVISLFLGFYVLINNPKCLSNRILFALTAVFSVWVYFNLILWASPTPESVMFFWSAIVPVEMLMYLLALYLVYVFAHNQVDMPTWQKLIYSLFLLPIFLFAHTSLNVIGLSPDCDAGAFEGILIQYMYVTEVVIISIAAYYLYKGNRTVKGSIELKQHRYVSIATICFLAFFTAGNLTLLFDLGPYYEQYKLFGMPIFAVIVAYSIIKLETFSAQAVLTEVLVSVLWMLMFSVLLLSDMSYARPIIAVSLLIFGLLAIQLVRSVKKEIKQREEIEKLATDLAQANVQLQKLDKQKSEFVSIASHQLRSPLTAIRGYASMLLEGNFGKIPQSATQSIERIEVSAKHMTLAVEDYLNVSRIESGNMKYELTDFNLRDEIERVCEDLRPIALKKGLVLLFRTDVKSRSIVHADIGKMVQVAHNLINNAIKYTPKGSITIFVRDDSKSKKIYVDIIDTGIGMSTETIQTLFRKFSRATNANKVNISGTGLGLFVALRMTEQMGGTISAHSEGGGKGSRFTIELPLEM